jgi:hypothetical protein
VAANLCLWVSGTVIHCHYSVSVLLFRHFADDIHPFMEHLTGDSCQYIISPANWQTVYIDLFKTNWLIHFTS